MAQLTIIDEEYRQWIQDISRRYRQSQIKASIRVNDEMLRFYWSLGKDIVEKKAESKCGTGFYNNLSRDLKQSLPDVKGLSDTNLRYMKRFYQLYADAIQAQVVPELEAGAEADENQALGHTNLCETNTLKHEQTHF